MHYYLIDERVAKTTPAAQLSRIQSWIKTSRIAGEQLSLKSPQHIMEHVKKITASASTATIVVLGDDLSLDLAISALIELEQDNTTPLGFIPLRANSKSAQLLGILDWKQATGALLKGKRENFHLLGVEDYAILSCCSLSPKHVDPPTEQAITLTLDRELILSIPSAELSLANISKDVATTHIQPILIEATASHGSDQLLQNKQPLIKLPVKHTASAQAKMLRLKASTITIETTSPLLLHSLIQLRPTIEVVQHTKQQPLIVSRKRDSLTHRRP